MGIFHRKVEKDGKKEAAQALHRMQIQAALPGKERWVPALCRAPCFALVPRSLTEPDADRDTGIHLDSREEPYSTKRQIIHHTTRAWEAREGIAPAQRDKVRRTELSGGSESKNAKITKERDER